jgi:hypothetical protein
MKPKLLAVALCVVAVSSLPGCKKSEPAGSAPDAKPSGAGQPSEAVELKAKWPVGNKYTYRVDLTQNIKMQIPGMPQPMLQVVTMAQTYSMAVLGERPNNGRELELQFDAMEMDIQMGGFSMSFDSKGDAEADKTNPFAAPFRKIMGSKLKLLLGGNGLLDAVEKLDEWLDKALEDSPPPAQGMIRGMYSQDFFKQLVETSKGLPLRPVKVGESWPFQTEVETGQAGKIALDVKVKLKGFEQHENRHCAVLESSGTIKGAGGGTAGPMGKSNIENGKISGTSWFDPELGATVGMDSDQKMQLKIEPLAGGPGGNKPFTGEVTQKVVLKLVDLKSTR